LEDEELEPDLDTLEDESDLRDFDLLEEE